MSLTFERFDLLWNSPFRMQSYAYWCDRESIHHVRMLQEECDRSSCTLTSLFFLYVKSGQIVSLSLANFACLPLKIVCILKDGLQERSSLHSIAQCVGRVFCETVGLFFLSAASFLPCVPIMDAYESLYQLSASSFFLPPHELFERLSLYEAFLTSVRCEMDHLKQERVFTQEELSDMGELVLHSLFCRAIARMVQSALFTEESGGIKRMRSCMKAPVWIQLGNFSDREERALSKENPLFCASMLLFRLSEMLKRLDVRERESLPSYLTCRDDSLPPLHPPLERASLEKLVRVRNALIAFKVRFVDRDFVRSIDSKRLLAFFA